MIRCAFLLALLTLLAVLVPPSHATWERIDPPVVIEHPEYDLDGFRAIADDGSNLLCIYDNQNLTVLSRRVGGTWFDIDSWWRGSFGGQWALDLEANGSHVFASVFGGNDVGNNETHLYRYAANGAKQTVSTCQTPGFNPACQQVNGFQKCGDAVFPNRGIFNYVWFDGVVQRTLDVRSEPSVVCGGSAFGTAHVQAAGLLQGAGINSALLFGDIQYLTCTPAHGLAIQNLSNGQTELPSTPAVANLRGLVPWENLLVGTGAIDGGGEGLVAWDGTDWELLAPFTGTVSEVQLLQGTIFIGGSLDIPGLGQVPYGAWRDGWFPHVTGLPGAVVDFAFADGNVYARVGEDVYRQELAVPAVHLSLDLVATDGTALRWSRADLPVDSATLERNGSVVQTWSRDLPVRGEVAVTAPFAGQQDVYTMLVAIGGETYRSEPVMVRGSDSIASEFTEVSPNPMRADGVRIAFRAATSNVHTVAVYDVRGRRVRQYSVHPDRPDVALSWDGRDEAGAGVPAGVYFLRLATSSSSDVRRVTLLR